MSALKYLWAAIAVCVLVSCAKQEPKADETSQPAVQKTTRATIENNKIKYTYTAFCQMRCNRYKTQQIRDAIRQGKYKTRNEWLERKPCPFYAVEYEMPDKRKLYLFLAACDNTTKIVRVYDSRKQKCDCATPAPKTSAKS